MKFFDELVERKFGRLGKHIFYRCHACSGIVLKNDIESNGSCKCGGRKVSPARLNLLEEVQMIWKAAW